MNETIIAAVITLWGGLLLYFIKELVNKRAINKAVLAEMKRLETVIRKHEKWWRGRIQESDIYHPLIPFSTPVYSSQISNIGLLDHKIVAHVVTFYGYLSFVNDYQTMRKHYDDMNHPNDFNNIYLGTIDRLLKSLPDNFDLICRRYGID